MVTNRYSNADGSLQGLLDDMVAKKALRDGALVNISIQKPKVEQLTNLYNDHKQKADACQAARNTANTGAGKNNKCHINTLTEHTNGAKRMKDQLDPAIALLKKYEGDLSKYEAELLTATNKYNTASGLNISSKPSDPILSNLLNNLTGSNGVVKSNKKLLLYGGIGLGVIVLTFVGIRMLK